MNNFSDTNHSQQKNRTEYYKLYREKNKFKLNENNKKYYNDKKDIVHSCNICDCNIKGFSIYRHLKSQKHIKNSTLFFMNQCSSMNKNIDDSTCELTNPSSETIEKNL